jgi:type II secretory pathway pseudopilin PulG
MRETRGFTMLEIIIAVTLIVLFIALPILAYTNYMKKSRDTKRKDDINKISAALELYKANNGRYPDPLNWQEALVEGGYLAEIPVDPRDGDQIPGGNGKSFGYEYNVGANGQSFTLSGVLEDGTTNSEDGTQLSYYISDPDGQDIITVTPAPSGATQGPPTKTPVPTISGVATNTPRPTKTPTPTNTPTPTRTPTPSPTPNADLVVQGITRGDGNYSVNVCNQGTGTNYLSGLWYTLYVNGLTYGGWDRHDFSPPLLAAGQCSAVEFSCNTLSWWSDPDCMAANTISAQIDQFSQVAELNESNNTTQVAFPAAPTSTPVPGPDLVIEDLTRNGNGTFTATYCNRGLTAPAGSTYIMLYMNGSPGYENYANITIPAVNTCASSTEISCNYACGQAVTVTAYIDSGDPVFPGSISEMNEGNNEYTEAFPAPTATPTPKTNTVLATWGGPSAGSGNGQYNTPVDTEINPGNTRVYVAENYGYRVQILNLSGTYQSQFAINPANGGPSDIDFDSSSNVYVLTWCNVQVHNSANTYVRQFGSYCPDPGFETPTGLAIDRTNNWIYIVMQNTGRVLKTDLNGNQLATWSGLNAPQGIDVDDSGNVWVANYTNWELKKYNSSGTLLNTYDVWCPPQDVEVRGARVHMQCDDVMFIFNTSMEITHISQQGTGVGSGGNGMSIDSVGDVYWADSYYHRIKKLRPE